MLLHLLNTVPGTGNCHVHVELEHRHCVWYADSSSPPELSTGTLVEEFRLARHGGGRLIIYLLFLANHLFFVRYLY